MRKLIIYSLFIILSLTSCQKCKNDKNAPKYTISGRIMENCTMPYANKQVSLYQPLPTTGNSGGTLASGSTDINGDFSLEYKPENGIYINLRNYNDNVLTKIPVEQTINLGTLTMNSTFKVVLKVKVYNNYASSADTFICGTWGLMTPFLMKTPLHDTIFPMYNAVSLLVPEYPHASETNISYRWFFINGNQHSNINYFYKYISNCSSTADTTTIIVN